MTLPVIFSPTFSSSRRSLAALRASFSRMLRRVTTMLLPLDLGTLNSSLRPIRVSGSSIIVSDIPRAGAKQRMPAIKTSKPPRL